MEIDFIEKYLTHLEFSRHTTISDVHELARDVLKACCKLKINCWKKTGILTNFCLRWPNYSPTIMVWSAIIYIKSCNKPVNT